MLRVISVNGTICCHLYFYSAISTTELADGATQLSLYKGRNIWHGATLEPSPAEKLENSPILNQPQQKSYPGTHKDFSFKWKNLLISNPQGLHMMSSSILDPIPCQYSKIWLFTVFMDCCILRLGSLPVIWCWCAVF